MHSAYLATPFFNFSERETHINKSYSRDFPQEVPYTEDNDKFYPNFSKGGSSFDSSNFGVFFQNKPLNSKSSNESYANRNHKKKKSHETSSNRESTMKRMSSKDYSNIEELYDDTTIITSSPEMKHQQNTKKYSNEVPLSRFTHDDSLSVVLEELSMPYNNYSERTEMRNGMRSGHTMPRTKTYKEERQEQSIMGTLSKLDLYGESEDQKAQNVSNMKLPKGNFNNEVIERIMSKALHHRRVNGINQSSNTSNFNTSSHNLNMSQHNQSEVRNNNNSVFNNGSRKNKKGTNFAHNQQNKKEVPVFDSYSQDPFRHSPPNVMFSPFESNRDFSTLNLGVQTPVSERMIQGTTNFLTKSLEAHDFINESEMTGMKMPNMSTLATDTTIDSDQFTTFNFNHNNSFSTLFSGTKNNSFNNSGKINFNSPIRADSGRFVENIHASANRNMISPQSHSVLPIQRNTFNMGQNLMTLYGSHASGNTTDRSNFSWNDEFTNSSALSTPQGRQHQSFFNISLNPQSLSAIKEHQCSCLPPANSSNPYHIQRSKTDNTTSGSNKNLTQSLNLSNSTSSTASKNKNQSSGKNINGNQKGNKKKNQEPKDSTLFEIDLDNIEKYPRTTLMIKNIPNKYDLNLIREEIEVNHKGKFDFFYLPIDPRNKCNVGYAFINFVDCKYIRDFYNEFNNTKWKKFNSEKICDIKYARIQGKKALMNHFQYSNVMSQQDKNLKPYIPAEYEHIGHKKIKDLVNKQRMESIEYDSEEN